MLFETNERLPSTYLPINHSRQSNLHVFKPVRESIRSLIFNDKIHEHHHHDEKLRIFFYQKKMKRKFPFPISSETILLLLSSLFLDLISFPPQEMRLSLMMTLNSFLFGIFPFTADFALRIFPLLGFIYRPSQDSEFSRFCVFR